jgi:hypothetical protein
LILLFLLIYYNFSTQKSIQKTNLNVNPRKGSQKYDLNEIGNELTSNELTATTSVNKCTGSEYESTSSDNVIESKDKKSTKLEVPQMSISENNLSNRMNATDRTSRRENRVAKTLAIVTIAYVICLFPFYFTLLITAVLGKNSPEKLLFSITLWLLYCNSLVNPIIYTIFNQNFRRAFKNILHIK